MAVSGCALQQKPSQSVDMTKHVSFILPKPDLQRRHAIRRAYVVPGFLTSPLNGYNPRRVWVVRPHCRSGSVYSDRVACGAA